MCEVININWERSNLIIKLNKKIKRCKIEGNKGCFVPEFKNNIIKICITNIDGKPIQDDNWCIEVNEQKVKINSNLLAVLDDKSRVFKYREDFYALIITFDLEHNSNFIIKSNYYMKNKNNKKYLRLTEGYTIKEKTKVFLKIITFKIINIIYNMTIHLYSKKNTILFLTENNDELSDNLKYLYNYLRDKYKIKIWTNNLYKNKKNSKVLRIKELIYISTSKYVFIDNYVSLYNIIKKNKKQILIQLWHAGIGFKAVGYARFGKENSPHAFISSHRQYDYVIVDNEDLIDIYKEVFGISKTKIIACGIPRMENYTNLEVIKNKEIYLFKKYPILKNKKIIMFAPTYRGESAENAYYDYNNINFDDINRFCKNNNFIFIIKNHPFIRNKITIKESFKNNILDLSKENINELLYITDILITDYSSCAYEYSYFNRPLIFYRFDKNMYEYRRPMHTISCFTNNQFEVSNFKELMKILNSLKEINIENRFDKMKIIKNNSCNIIEKTILKGGGK